MQLFFSISKHCLLNRADAGQALKDSPPIFASPKFPGAWIDNVFSFLFDSCFDANIMKSYLSSFARFRLSSFRIVPSIRWKSNLASFWDSSSKSCEKLELGFSIFLNWDSWVVILIPARSCLLATIKKFLYIVKGGKIVL